MATRKSSSKPALAAVDGATSTDATPCNIKGPVSMRINLANGAAWQVQVILRELMSRDLGEGHDTDFAVARALIHRAHSLARSAITLLSIDDDPAAVDAAVEDARHA